MCWRDVIPEMDYEGFSLPSPSGLSIIMTTFNVASKDPFPIDMIYGPWVHTKGQVRICFSEVHVHIKSTPSTCNFETIVNVNKTYVQYISPYSTVITQ